MALFMFPEAPEYVCKNVPPELVAVKVKLDPSQTDVAGAATRVTVGVGSIFTECMADAGAPQPVAVAVIWVVPVHPGA